MTEHRALAVIAVLVAAGGAGAVSPALALLVVACATGCWLALVTLRQTTGAREQTDESRRVE